MKRINFIAFVFLALIVSGCVSIPNSPTPRFYALSSTDKVGAISNNLNAIIIGIGPVKIPEYLDRPQMVTINKAKMLQFAQFDRWGESLDLGLARLIREDLTINLPKVKWTLYPWNPSMPVRYQVLVEIVQLDSQLDRDMFFVAQWTIIDLKDSKTLLVKRSEFRKAINPPNYSGLAQTLSTACSSLSDQIAQALASLKTKADVPLTK